MVLGDREQKSLVLGTNPNQIINIDLHGATDLIEGFHDQKNLNKFCSI
jgi:hypothetical protein